MDRNLGASQVATSPTDEKAFGDLYQWGRGTDGHEKRNSGTTLSPSGSDQPSDKNFILALNGSIDWRIPQNRNLWQGVKGVNNPCPSGFRIPTNQEWNDEISWWGTNNSTNAFNSILKLSLGGNREIKDGKISDVGVAGYYWSSTSGEGASGSISFTAIFSNKYTNPTMFRLNGRSVRCIKD